jgi:hypothetical protein
MVAPGGRLRSHINCERYRFFRNADPFDREVADDTIRWPEGEKDVETLSNQLLLAVTFGGTGDGLTLHNTPTKPQANSSAPLGVNFT